MEITADQIRAARALLRMEQAELAGRSHVSVVTVRRLERVGGPERVTAPNVEGIRLALEQAGAEFIPGGVRWRRGRQDEVSLYEDLRAISLRSAARLQDRDLLTDADLYDENGLPV